MLALFLVLAAADVSQADPQTAPPVPTSQATDEPTEIIQVYRGEGYFNNALAENLRLVLTPDGGKGLVWVNTETHVYHKESSRWYGRTKHGKYMSEVDAIKEGDEAAKNEK
jgi:hypothetical protein